ncbi:AMP-binding protein [Lichenicoccus sp.]|uniref:AMP-binding protein n=1 Tax=Lichenicoccus sp. TaxID=2781899 RepID=UPI003D0ADB2D
MALPALLSSRLRLPVICSPLFIISNPDLVIAQCTAGVVGSFPSLNARPLSLLDEWLHRITEALTAWDRDHPDRPSAPFAVNQIVHRTNDRLEQDLDLCARHKVPLVITSLGAREDLNRAVHAWGGLVLHDVINDGFARKAIEKGADGLIAVAAGAGGHAGKLSPFALVQEVRQWFTGPVALSGAIGTGRAILAAQAMGADLAYIGSLFIASAEANAAAGYKQMIVDSRADDIVYSNLFTGVHGNYLRPSIVAAGLDPDALPQSDAKAMSFGSASTGKAKAWRDIWGCGQGIGAVDAILPAAEQVARLAREYAAAKLALDQNYTPQSAETAPTIVAGDRVRTHAEIRDRAARAAHGLRTLGIHTGDTVALLLRNDFAFFEATLGAALAGAFPVPINWHATADEAGYVLRDCGARVLVAHRDLLPGVQAGLPDGLVVLVVETPAEVLAAYRAQQGAKPGAIGWDGWIARQAPIAEPAAMTRAAVIYTSGTTGKPKGVKRPPSTSSLSMQAAAEGYGLAGEAPRTVLMNGPMYHSAPNSYAQIAFAGGAAIVLQPRFDAKGMLALIARHRVTHMHVVPTMFVRLLSLPQATKARYDLSSLRFVVHGAAPCSPEVKKAMIAWWGPVIHEYYGSTETGLITALGPQDALRKPGSVGRALRGVTIKVLDEGGHERVPGEAGDVFIHSAAASSFSYIGRDAARAELDGETFITLGDIGTLDEEGFLFLCDRRRDMIISGGVNIYPAEIEAGLLAVPGVLDCAVFGIPDAEFGEAVCAYVQPDGRGNLDAVSIRTALGQRLIPIVLVPDSQGFPRGARSDSLMLPPVRGFGGSIWR